MLWLWRQVTIKDEAEFFAILSPNRSHGVSCLGVVHALLMNRRLADNSPLLFNLIVAGDLTEAPEGAYSWIN